MDSNQEEEIQLRVALYLRVSTEDQVEKYGLDAQKAAIEGMLKSRGQLKSGQDRMILAGSNFVYVDEGISGTNELGERPEFARLVEDIVDGDRQGKMPFDFVAVYRIDRFARKLRILMDVIKLFEQYKIQFISATESIDTSSPFGRAMLSILGVIAELELETFRERSKGGREQAIQKGVFMGSHPPFGYRKDKDKRLEIVPEEAEVVKQIYSLFNVEKLSPQKIAGFLKESEILSPDASAVLYGKRKGTSHKVNSPHFWRAEQVRSILSDDIYTGDRYYGKNIKNKPVPKTEWKLSDYHHTPIIPTDLFELTKFRLAQFSDRKVMTKKKEEGTTYLLSGLLKCDHCRKLVVPVEAEMMSWTGDRKEIGKGSGNYSHYYHCNRKNRAKHSIVCPVVPIPAEPLERYVTNFVIQLLTNPQAAYEYQNQLASTKLNQEHLQANREHLLYLLNLSPRKIQSVKEQHENLMIDTPTLLKKVDSLKKQQEGYVQKIKGIDHQLSNIILSTGYKESFKLYAEKYGKSLDKILKNRQELYDLIHRLIYEVIVYSRPRKDTDIIAGRKKIDQFIPDHIDIYLNLPQNLLRELVTQKFGVKHNNL